jgi:hypothetical protein
MEEEFEKISIDISDTDQQSIVELYVKQHLEPASLSAYLDSIQDGDSYEVALKTAIINETLLTVLRKQLDLPFNIIP